MSRYIDADALREKWLCLQGHDFSPSSFVYSIDNESTVDAVPVVRCGECKYRHDSIMCPMRSEGMDTPDNWFCADGKRKDYPEVDAIYFSDGTVVSGERKDGKNGN